MKTKEMIKYLRTFDRDSELGLLVIDDKAETAYKTKGIELVKDDGLDFPVIAIELGEARDLKELAREDG